jgi:hypothetical protein
MGPPRTTYTWSNTLFTVFLDTLNNTCDGDETTACTSHADCVGIGNGKCGHAGFRDWRIPHIKELQSIVNYGVLPPGPTIDPTFPGLTANAYWSSTPSASGPAVVYIVIFFNSGQGAAGTSTTIPGRAVRGGQ